jgi:hypothetical protein
MSKKNKLEKRVLKKLHKLMKQAANVSDHESRLVMVTGPYGFSVVRMEEDPDSTSMYVVDRYFHLMNTSIHNALGTNTGSKEKQKPKTIRLIPYDGSTLKDISKQDFNYSQPDYAKMQGIDLDEAADRQMDLYTEGADTRKALVMHKATTNRQMDNYIDTTNERKAELVKNASGVEKELFLRAQIEGIVKSNAELKRQLESYKRDMEGSQKAYEKQKADLEAKETELKHAYDKAAEDYETIQKLTKEVGDLKIQIGKQNETIFQLKHPTPIEVASIVPVSEKHNELSTIVTDMNTKIDKLAEKVDSAETKEDKPEKPTGPDYAYPVVLLRPKINREIELEDKYAFRRLDEIKKPYRLRDIFKIVHNEMYTEIHDNVYNLLGEIENPITTQVQKFPRQAYALAIALAAPASYVSAFCDRLIEDYRKGDFVPTRKSCIPENFENLLECLYPEICRIQQILFHDTNKLPYVYKKYSKNGLYTFYMIGAKSYDTPDEVPTKTYVAIPKDEEPYEYINLGREEKLMYVLEHGQCMKKRDPLAAMNDCEYGPERLYSDYPHTLKDQIDEMIGASEETIITLDTTDPEEVYKTQLRYYPIYPAYTDTFVNEPEK